MRTIQSIGQAEPPSNFCTKCNKQRAWFAFVDEHHYDLPCGHSWSEYPPLTPEELTVALLMMPEG